MKLKVIKRYFDKLEDVYVKEGAVIERDPDRAEHLIAVGVAQDIRLCPNEGMQESEEGPDKEAAQKPKGGSKSRKK